VRPHRNVTGYPLQIRRFNNLTVGPGEVVDLDEIGHDPGEHGVITGLEPVQDEPAAAQEQPVEPAKSKKPAAKASDTAKETTQ
jgi:hypothetical protein